MSSESHGHGDALKAKASAVRLVGFDVDGVLTNGQLGIASDGQETKFFHVHDGHGVKQLLRLGFEVAWISARQSASVARRAAELGVVHLFQGELDKWPRLDSLARSLNLDAAQIAYMGDDLPDLECLHRVGLAAAPADAQPAILAAVDWVSSRNGGSGAVREFVELLLAARVLAEGRP